MAPSISFLLLLLVAVCPAGATGSTFGFDIHHRFSDKFRTWAQSVSPEEAAGWPATGTPEYYAALVVRDRALLRGRRLATNPDHLTFAKGNNTVKIPFFGSLHYAEISLGTPNVTMLVALDTGSNLMWVPCDCKNCVSASGFDIDYNFQTFKSNASTTVQRINCSSALCSAEYRRFCRNATAPCPYRVKFFDNTSTSGVLLQDVMYFSTDDARRRPVQARVTFGCGQVQENTDIPTGLMGLGLRSMSVPSTLAAGGFTADSFSMCFSPDGNGRVSFGDKGSPQQHTTPYSSNFSIYGVTVVDTVVGNHTLNTTFHAYFDTGSSFTLLGEPVHTILAERFGQSLMGRQRIQTDGSRIPFDYCYELKLGVFPLHLFKNDSCVCVCVCVWLRSQFCRNDETKILVPKISLKMEGGDMLVISNPVVGLVNSANGELYAFCLAIIPSDSINIIGQSFMTDHKVVFDRESRVIGWMKFDCYKNVGLEVQAPVPGPSPSPNTSSILKPRPSPSPVQNAPRTNDSSTTSASESHLQSKTLLLTKLFWLLLFIF